jgi:hypothetical protein
MASKDLKVSEQGTASWRRNVTLIIQQKLQTGGLKMVGPEERLWFHTTLNCQISMI